MTDFELSNISIGVGIIESGSGAEISKSFSDGGPEDGNFCVRDWLSRFGDCVSDLSALLCIHISVSSSTVSLESSGTYLVTRNVPVLDTSVLLFRILRVMSDISNGVNVLCVSLLDSQQFVNSDSPVLLEFKA